MAIYGTDLTISNPRFKFFGFLIVCLIAFGVMFYWREQTLKQAEYVDFPTKHNRALQAELKSQNYQIDVQDSSPAAQ